MELQSEAVPTFEGEKLCESSERNLSKDVSKPWVAEDLSNAESSAFGRDYRYDQECTSDDVYDKRWLPMLFC